MNVTINVVYCCSVVCGIMVNIWPQKAFVMPFSQPCSENHAFNKPRWATLDGTTLVGGANGWAILNDTGPWIVDFVSCVLEANLPRSNGSELRISNFFYVVHPSM